MAKLQCRAFPDDIYEKLVNDAREQSRSLEGHIRFLLAKYYSPSEKEDTETGRNLITVELPEWMVVKLNESASAGYRSLNFEVLKRLTESLASDDMQSHQKG